MNLLTDALAWLSDPANWTGSSGLPTRMAEHLAITAAAVLIAALVALPAGIAVGHARRGAGVVGGIAGAARAVPSLGLLTLLGLWLGIGLEAPLITLVVLAVPSLLAGAYAGIEAIDPGIPQAARAIGLNTWQVVGNVEIPLAMPVLIGGIRAATLQVVATATLAAYTADFGLGRYLFAGLKSRDYAQMLGGSLVVIALALVLEVMLSLAQRLAARKADPAHAATSAHVSPAP